MVGVDDGFVAAGWRVGEAGGVPGDGAHGGAWEKGEAAGPRRGEEEGFGRAA